VCGEEYVSSTWNQDAFRSHATPYRLTPSRGCVNLPQMEAPARNNAGEAEKAEGDMAGKVEHVALAPDTHLTRRLLLKLDMR
jgi:hypothetical protein